AGGSRAELPAAEGLRFGLRVCEGCDWPVWPGRWWELWLEPTLHRATSCPDVGLTLASYLRRVRGRRRRAPGSELRRGALWERAPPWGCVL
ncbi:unnamed protein product, partial [Lampetra fluviatilis]